MGIAVEYNYQLHQMFNALHPHCVHTAERSGAMHDPARIKIVHFSGEPLAKPWHRVLDKRFAHLWPDRAHDSEYADIFIEEFYGYWIWIKHDKSAWDKVAEQKGEGKMSAFMRA